MQISIIKFPYKENTNLNSFYKKYVKLINVLCYFLQTSRPKVRTDTAGPDYFDEGAKPDHRSSMSDGKLFEFCQVT